jgi:DNA-binding CsgD family transcriptional regulator
MARIQYHDESLVSAVALLEEALPQAEGAPELQVTIRRDLAWARSSMGDLCAAESDVREALRLMPGSADSDLVASTWSVGSVALFLTGHGADISLLEQAEELQQRPAAVVEFDPLSCRASLLKWTDRFEESRSCYRRLRRRQVELGNDGALPFVYFQHSELELWAGRWDEAAELASTGSELAELTEQRSFSALCLYVTGLVEAHRGHTQAARDALTKALSLGEAVTSVQAWVHTAFGFLELSLGEAGPAHSHLAPFADIETMIGLREPGVWRHVPDVVETLLLLGDTDTARPLARRLEERGKQFDRPYGLAAGARCNGLVAAADGALDESRAAFDRALTAHQRLDQPFELARTQLAHGIVLRRAKQRSAARGSLQAALAGFDRLGAQLWSEKARNELTRVGAAVHSAVLTPTEARIADLVAVGRTNREVAATLSITVKTVEVTLTRVYRKLGVRSRTELAHVRSAFTA